MSTCSELANGMTYAIAYHTDSDQNWFITTGLNHVHSIDIFIKIKVCYLGYLLTIFIYVSDQWLTVPTVFFFITPWSYIVNHISSTSQQHLICIHLSATSQPYLCHIYTSYHHHLRPISVRSLPHLRIQILAPSFFSQR